MKRINSIILLLALFVFLGVELNASSPQMTLVEEVTSGNCGACAGQNPALYDYIEQNMDKVVPVIYHSGNGLDEPMYDHNPGMLGQRIWGTYVSGTLGTPAAWANGKKVMLSSVKTEVSMNSSKESPVTMYVIEERIGSNVNVTVIVHSDEAFTQNQDIRMHLVIIESEIRTPSALRNGEKVFPWVARTMLPGPHPSEGEKIVLTAGQGKSYKFSFTMHPDWDASKIYVSAFIQDFKDANKKVIQAASTMDASQAKPKLTLSANTLDFKKVSISSKLSLGMTNSGIANLKVNSIQIDDDEDAVFSIVSEPFTEITPYETKQVEIEFNPKANKNYSAVLKLTTNDPSSAIKYIQIYGIGFDVKPVPKIELSTDVIDFGNVSGKTQKELVISNKGTGVLTISAFSFSEDSDEEFGIVTATPVLIEPGSELPLVVEFNPPANGLYTASMTIKSDAINMPEVTVDISGIGENIIEKSEIVSNLEELDFGETLLPVEKAVTISNKGYKILNISSIKISGTDASLFSIIGKTPTVLFQDESEDIKIKFTPEKEGKFTAELIIKSDADNQKELKIMLVGEGNFTSVEEISSSLFDITVSPNPANSQARISIENYSEQSRNVNLEIYGLTGELIQKLAINQLLPGINHFKLDTSHLNSGAYRIVAIIDGQAFGRSFSIVK